MRINRSKISNTKFKNLARRSSARSSKYRNRVYAIYNALKSFSGILPAISVLFYALSFFMLQVYFNKIKSGYNLFTALDSRDHLYIFSNSLYVAVAICSMIFSPILISTEVYNTNKDRMLSVIKDNRIRFICIFIIIILLNTLFSFVLALYLVSFIELYFVKHDYHYNIKNVFYMLSIIVLIVKSVLDLALSKYSKIVLFSAVMLLFTIMIAFPEFTIRAIDYGNTGKYIIFDKIPSDYIKYNMNLNSVTINKTEYYFTPYKAYIALMTKDLVITSKNSYKDGMPYYYRFKRDEVYLLDQLDCKYCHHK